MDSESIREKSKIRLPENWTRRQRAGVLTMIATYAASLAGAEIDKGLDPGLVSVPACECTRFVPN